MKASLVKTIKQHPVWEGLAADHLWNSFSSEFAKLLPAGMGTVHFLDHIFRYFNIWFICGFPVFPSCDVLFFYLCFLPFTCYFAVQLKIFAPSEPWIWMEMAIWISKRTCWQWILSMQRPQWTSWSGLFACKYSSQSWSDKESPIRGLYYFQNSSFL